MTTISCQLSVQSARKLPPAQNCVKSKCYGPISIRCVVIEKEATGFLTLRCIVIVKEATGKRREAPALLRDSPLRSTFLSLEGSSRVFGALPAIFDISHPVARILRIVIRRLCTAPYLPDRVAVFPSLNRLTCWQRRDAAHIQTSPD